MRILSVLILGILVSSALWAETKNQEYRCLFKCGKMRTEFKNPFDASFDATALKDRGCMGFNSLSLHSRMTKDEKPTLSTYLSYYGDSPNGQAGSTGYINCDMPNTCIGAQGDAYLECSMQNTWATKGTWKELAVSETGEVIGLAKDEEARIKAVEAPSGDTPKAPGKSHGKKSH